MKKKDYIIAGIIVCVAFIFRLYRIDAPLADFHSWRQADTAAVARNFERNGFNLMMPQYDDLSNLQSGMDNPQGYRFVEFPLYNALFGYSHMVFPQLSLETWGRLIAILFSLLAIISLYYIALTEAGRTAAIVTTITYAVMPFFVYFSRVVLPDSPAVAMALVSIALLRMFIMEHQKLRKFFFITASMVSFALSLLMKPTTIFYALPLLIIFLRTYRFNSPKKLHIILYFICTVIPLLLWRYYITFYPEGVPASTWLISQVNTFEGQKDIFMRPAFFRWIFFERINNLMLGGYLTTLFVVGLLKKQKTILPISIIAASFIYLMTFEGGNVQHAYYQIGIFPGVALAVGLGAAALIESSSFAKFITVPAVVMLFIGSFFFSYFQVKDYYNIPQDLLLMANIIKTFTLPSDKIVADRMGDTTLLYLADRRGMPLLYREPDQLKADGYRFILTDKQEIIQKLKDQATKVLFENAQFALFAL